MRTNSHAPKGASLSLQGWRAKMARLLRLVRSHVGVWHSMTRLVPFLSPSPSAAPLALMDFLQASAQRARKPAPAPFFQRQTTAKASPRPQRRSLELSKSPPNPKAPASLVNEPSLNNQSKKAALPTASSPGRPLSSPQSPTQTREAPALPSPLRGLGRMPNSLIPNVWRITRATSHPKSSSWSRAGGHAVSVSKRPFAGSSASISPLASSKSPHPSGIFPKTPRPTPSGASPAPQAQAKPPFDVAHHHALQSPAHDPFPMDAQPRPFAPDISEHLYETLLQRLIQALNEVHRSPALSR